MIFFDALQARCTLSFRAIEIPARAAAPSRDIPSSLSVQNASRRAAGCFAKASFRSGGADKDRRRRCARSRKAAPPMGDRVRKFAALVKRHENFLVDIFEFIRGVSHSLTQEPHQSRTNIVGQDATSIAFALRCMRLAALATCAPRARYRLSS